MRENCLLCKTKSLTGKLLTQDCTRWSIVYETRYMTCEERSKNEIEEKYNIDEIEDSDEREKKKISKYIGETGKSCYER